MPPGYLDSVKAQGLAATESAHEELIAKCEKQRDEIDIPTCRQISRARGKAAGRRCYASAMERYSACLKGKSLPPLDTWNN
jgi:hypothetical protein